MIRNIVLPLIIAILTAVVVLISNKFGKKKIVLDKHYALKAIILFLLSVIILTILDHLL